MANRTALAAASIAAAGTLAVALAAAGFVPAPAGSTDPGATVADPAATDQRATPTFQVDTIYLAPAADPGTVTRNERSGHEDGEHEGEGESGDDD